MATGPPPDRRCAGWLSRTLSCDASKTKSCAAEPVTAMFSLLPVEPFAHVVDIVVVAEVELFDVPPDAAEADRALMAFASTSFRDEPVSAG